MKRANYEIVTEESTAEVLVIRDIGPHSEYKTVTNAAEVVVAELYDAGELPAGRRLFYYDSLNNRDELVREGRVFKGFAPARTIVIKEHESPEDLQRAAEVFRSCLDRRPGRRRK